MLHPYQCGLPHLPNRAVLAISRSRKPSSSFARAETSLHDVGPHFLDRERQGASHQGGHYPPAPAPDQLQTSASLPLLAEGEQELPVLPVQEARADTRLTVNTSLSWFFGPPSTQGGKCYPSSTSKRRGPTTGCLVSASC